MSMRVSCMDSIIIRNKVYSMSERGRRIKREYYRRNVPLSLYTSWSSSSHRSSRSTGRCSRCRRCRSISSVRRFISLTPSVRFLILYSVVRRSCSCSSPFRTIVVAIQFSSLLTDRTVFKSSLSELFFSCIWSLSSSDQEVFE